MKQRMGKLPPPPSHITMSDTYMTDVEVVDITVVVGNGNEITCTKRGTLRLKTEDGNLFLLKRVLYTPKFHKNIVSVGVLIKCGYYVHMSGSTMTMESPSTKVTFSCEGGGVLYYLRALRTTTTKTDVAMFLMQKQTVMFTARRTPLDINTAHDIYGHIGEAALRTTLLSLNVELTGKLLSCESCALAKAKAKKVSKISTTKATYAGERLYLDISGPYKKSIVGSDYWVLVVDDFTSKSWSFFTKKKSALSQIIEGLLTKLLAASYVTKYVRCDNAGENLTSLSLVCDKFGIIIEYTAPNTPQQNGVVERKFVTIRDRSSAAMHAARNKL